MDNNQNLDSYSNAENQPSNLVSPSKPDFYKTGIGVGKISAINLKVVASDLRANGQHYTNQVKGQTDQEPEISLKNEIHDVLSFVLFPATVAFLIKKTESL